MESESEKLQLEIKGSLYCLTAEQLMKVCSILQISGHDEEFLTSKTRSQLISYITEYIERDELASLEDEGMSDLLSIHDIINNIQLQSKKSEMEAQTDEQENLQKEIEQLKLTIQKKEKIARDLMNRNLNPSPSIPVRNVTPATPDSSVWRKDFKIAGQIGEPGQKDRLTFSSLARQIESGLNKGHSETDIIDAVIRAITPGLQLRSYLEGKESLTLPALRRILRSHYQERGATDLYKQLTSEVQNSKESPQNFLIRAMDLRQKILFASQEAESGLKYSPALVQSLFLHTVLTGLQNDNIKSDLQPYLMQPNTSDELLLERVNIACTNEKERQDKKRHAAPSRVTSVSTVQTTLQAEKNKNDSQQSTAPLTPALLSEIKEIQSDMVLLKDLRAEVSQIRETIQKTTPAPPIYPPPNQEQQSVLVSGPELPAPQSATYVFQPHAMPFYPHQQPAVAQRYQPVYGPGRMGETAQFQRGFAPQRYYQKPRSVPRCFACVQSGEEYCQHCFRCGSTEHFRAGCRAERPTKTDRGPLN